jgi:sarcosine oxidase, subunit alpha
VAAVFDARADPQGAAVSAAREAGLPARTGMCIIDCSGHLRVNEVMLGAPMADGTIRDAGRVPCDCVLMSGGWTPSVHLFSQSRGKLRFDAAAGAFLPGVSAQTEISAGACAGVWGLGEALASGSAAGRAAAEACDFATSAVRVYRVDDALAAYAHADAPRMPQGISKAFVDFQNDVTSRDLELAAREGFRSIEHIKRYTTTGMATDQGKTSNVNALAVVSETLNVPVPSVGLTTFRQPYTPVTFGTLAGYARGDLFDPIRRTPMDTWAQGKDAVFEDVGTWKRAWYFPRAKEDMHAAVARECRTVRTAVGVFDASTLGKIEVVGPDAAEFLDRVYVNAFKTLKPGRCRYGILLNEAGFVIDDGVIDRMAPDRFHVTTTTGGAASVLNMMEDYLQTEWPHLQVWLTSTTEQWAVIAVQGPRARGVIAPMVDGADIGGETFPHMSVCEVKVAGVPARLFRVSFTGELGFEINVPASSGRAVWDAVAARVEDAGGCAYGTEAMHVLRAEKGYIIVGQETDGTVVPDDLGLTWAIGKSKTDFVGRRSLTRADMTRADRKQLVGLLTQGRDVLLDEGAQVTSEAVPAKGTTALGHVTSSYHSPALGRPIALALVKGGRGLMGRRLFVPMPKGPVEVEVVSPVFYDPKGEKLNG